MFLPQTDATRYKPHSRRYLWLGAAALTILFLGYMSTWWNHGIQLNSNGMPVLAGQAILDGKLPYRDFHFWCPPGHLLIYAALIGLFGNGLIVIRAFGVVEHLATFLIVYFWLTRFFSARVAFFGSFAASIGYCSDNADVIVHYDYDAVLAAVAAGLCASFALSKSTRHPGAFRVAAGICAGICLLMKQTTGVGIFLLFPAIFLFTERRLRGVLEYLAGWLTPIVPVVAWLVHGNAFGDFITQNFLKGTSSKGSLFSILFRPILTLFISKMLLLSFVLAAVAIAGAAYLCLHDYHHERDKSPLPLAVGSAVALLAAFAFAWSPLLSLVWQPAIRVSGITSAFFIFFAFFGSGLLALVYTIKLLFKQGTERDRQMWLLAAVSFVVAYMFSLSFAAYERMLIPSFAFVAAWLMQRGSKLIPIVTMMGLVLITSGAVRKLVWPYIWENWTDGTIQEQTVTSSFPELRGIRITPTTNRFLNRVTEVIQSHSLPTDKILCYPNYALFYVLSHREPGVFAFMHWFDITPDYMAKEDSIRIKEHPPAVIAFVDMPEKDIQLLEMRFRGKQRSGQRDLIYTIQTLPGYRLVDSIPIPAATYNLKILAREP